MREERGIYCLVHFGSVCKVFRSCLCAFNFRICRSLIHELFNRGFFEPIDFVDWDRYFVFHPKDPRLKIYREVCDDILSILNFETCCSSLAALKILWWVPTGSSSEILLKIRSVRILDMIFGLGALLWLFTSA